MDWERHLIMGFLSEKVANIVSQFFSEALRKRYEHIARRINETLKENEVALLIIQEEHMVQFPSDIEVFIVAPPVLDEIHRWLRDRRTEKKDEA
jgi:guanylate kinase